MRKEIIVEKSKVMNFVFLQNSVNNLMSKYQCHFSIFKSDIILDRIDPEVGKDNKNCFQK